MKSKSLLIASVVLNVLLFAMTDYLWTGRAEPFAPGKTAVNPAAVQRWNWSEIASADPLALAANLRSIGCPEETIRRIVERGEERAAAKPEMRSDPQAAWPTYGGGGGQGATLSPAGSPDRNESGAPGAAPVAPTARAGSSVTAPTANNVSVASDAAPTPARVVVPLAFQQVNSTGAAPVVNNGTSGGAVAGGRAGVAPSAEMQQAAVAQAQNTFLDQLGGAQQNPGDPAYAQKWVQAQQRSDDLLRSLMGDEAYNQYQLNAARQSVGQGR